MYQQLDPLFFERVKDEHKRIERIKEQSKHFKQLHVSSKVDESRLILDFNLFTGSPRVEVDPVLSKELKDHQREGIKFLYYSTIENVDMLDKPGSGCILAHKSGLGKTLLTIGFIHTILSNRFINDQIKTILIVAPDNRSEKWIKEVDKWIIKKNLPILKTYQVKFGNTRESTCETLRQWKRSGGVLIIEETHLVTVSTDSFDDNVFDLLTNPGPSLVVLDDRSIDFFKMISEIRRAISIMKTKRRIILTNTPILEAVPERLCAIASLVKPLLFGYHAEFNKRSVIPVGQLPYNRMYLGSAKLHELVKVCIQQKGMETYKRCLPVKYDYALCVAPSQLTVKMYNHYLDHADSRVNLVEYSFLFTINHPALHREFKLSELSRTEREYFEWVPNALSENIGSDGAQDLIDKNWFESFIGPNDWKKSELSSKFVLLFKILEKSIAVDDKLVVASQSPSTLNLVEKCLKLFSHTLVSNNAKWKANVNYFRLDDEDDYQNRVGQFNDPANKDARVCLINSTNFINQLKLTGANRCIILDVLLTACVIDHLISLLHSIEQTKSVYIYRLIMKDTFEDATFHTQLTKTENTLKLVFPELGLHETSRVLSMRPKECYKIPSLIPPSDSILADILTENNQEVLGYVTLNSVIQRGSKDWPKSPKSQGTPRNRTLADAMTQMFLNSMHPMNSF